jgi:hypothetical protein
MITNFIVWLILLLQRLALGCSILDSDGLHTIKHLAHNLFNPEPLCVTNAAKLDEDKRIVQKC